MYEFARAIKTVEGYSGSPGARSKIVAVTFSKRRVEHERLLSDYRSYLDHNELELALDMLQELGDLVPCRGGYWRDLERAAETMGLQNRIPYLRERFRETGKAHT